MSVCLTSGAASLTFAVELLRSLQKSSPLASELRVERPVIAEGQLLVNFNRKNATYDCLSVNLVQIAVGLTRMRKAGQCASKYFAIALVLTTKPIVKEDREHFDACFFCILGKV